MDDDLILIAVSPPNLHKIHLASERDALPLCGAQSAAGFECVGNVGDDGARHVNSCMRCLRKWLQRKVPEVKAAVERMEKSQKVSRSVFDFEVEAAPSRLPVER
jgi:hypothetical protein